MKYLLAFAPFVALIVAGCGSSDTGDVATAEKAAQAALKGPDQLPPDVSAEGRRLAESAVGQQSAMAQQMAKQQQARQAALRNR
jgi:uncharacterized protein YcfL